MAKVKKIMKTTKKDIMNRSRQVLAIGYCELYKLFSKSDRSYYTAGVNGWSCDVHYYGSIAITTGYRPFGHKVSHELVKKYDELMKEVQAKYKDFDVTNDKYKAFEELKAAFINEALEELKAL